MPPTDPFAPFAPAASRRPWSLTGQDEAGLLGGIDSLLGGLEYVGGSLAKPGRAVRGLLGGRPDELLAALPFSDSLGLTDEADQVTGRDLLEMGGFEPGDGLGGTLAGIGVDVATDPLTYAGGALAKALLGGRFRNATARSSAVPESLADDAGIYGLAPGETFGTGALQPPAPVNPRVVHYPEVVPEQAATSSRIGLPVLDTSPLTSLPEPSSYGFISDVRPSIPGDMMQDGRLVDALRTNMRAWDDAAFDLERLTPEAREALTGKTVVQQEFMPRPEYYDGLYDMGDLPPLGSPANPIEGSLEVAYRFQPPTNLGQTWQSLMEGQSGDLTAIHSLRDALMPGAADALVDPAREQFTRLSRFQGGLGGAMSPASLAARDIANGRTRPGEIPGLLAAGGLDNLPIDPRGLRRMAAASQRDEALASLTSQTTDFVLDNGDVVGPRDLLDNAGLRNAIEDQEYILDRLRAAFDPASALYRGMEPGIVKEVLAGRGPGIGEYATSIADARELMGVLAAEEAAVQARVDAMRRAIAADLERTQYNFPARDTLPDDWGV